MEILALLAGSAVAKWAFGIGSLLVGAAALWFRGRRAGAATVAARQDRRDAGVRQRQLDAAAKAPGSKRDLVERLRRGRFVLLLALLPMSGCGVVQRWRGYAHPPCPPVVEYDIATQRQAADELTALPEGAVLVRMLRDYIVMRDQSRACGLS